MAATPRLSKNLVQKGNAKPSAPAAKGETVSLTFKLDKERYQKLVTYGATFVPRKTNQQILLEALDTYLEQKGGK
jgi:hypothetical protein